MNPISVAMKAVRAFDHSAYFTEIAPVVRVGPVRIAHRLVLVSPNGKFSGAGRVTVQLCDADGQKYDLRTVLVEFSGR
jgi:hypothetical protein